MLSHRNPAENALALHAAWGFSERDVLLHALPVFHVHCLFVAPHCALLSGAPMIRFPKFSDAEVLVRLRRATGVIGVPTFYTRLLANAVADWSPELRLLRLSRAPRAPPTASPSESFHRVLCPTCAYRRPERGSRPLLPTTTGRTRARLEHLRRGLRALEAHTSPARNRTRTGPHVLTVTVGTALSSIGSGRPPYRSQRAELPHWAPTLGSGQKSLLRPRVQQHEKDVHHDQSISTADP